MPDEALLKRAEKGNGGAFKMLPEDRAWATYYDRTGQPLRLPADPASFMLYVGDSGFTLKPPKEPEARPSQITARDGSTINLDDTAQDWDGTLAPLPGQKPTAAPAAAAVAPTLTYYTAEGHPLPGLPADPASMTAYLAAGLRLSPPEGTDMAHTTGMYWNRDGFQEGPFPNWGEWPAIYAQSGYSLEPPAAPVFADDDEPDNEDLESMGMDALKALAAASEINVTGLKSKVAVRKAITEARAAAAVAAQREEVSLEDLEQLDLDTLLSIAEEREIDLDDVDTDSEEDVIAAIRLWAEANPNAQ